MGGEALEEACRHYIALSTCRHEDNEQSRALVSRLVDLFPSVISEVSKSLGDVWELAEAENWSAVSDCLSANPSSINKINEVSR